MDLTTTDSPLKRRAIITLTIIPYSALVAVRCAYYGVKNLWVSAGEQWSRRA